MDVSEKIVSIATACRGSMSLTFNSHRDSYESVKEYLEILTSMGNLDIGEDVSQDVYDKIIETDTLIELTCYPNTPVGSYTVYGYDLNMVIDEMIEVLKL